MLIDTHAHLDFKEFDKDREHVIRRAFSSGIIKIINIGCNLKRSLASIELAHVYDNIYASVGVHPHESAINNIEKTCREIYRLAKDPKVVALGEIGLDYSQIQKESEMNVQKNVFRAQLDIARELDKPVIFHCRDAYADMYDIIKKDNIKRGVSHCFLGDINIAQSYIDLGLYISFTGVITFKKAVSIQQVVRKIPLQKIMVETDSPFLSPEPYRGQRNEPARVKHIAEKIASLKEVELDKVEDITTQNAENLFNI